MIDSVRPAKSYPSGVSISEVVCVRVGEGGAGAAALATIKVVIYMLLENSCCKYLYSTESLK